MKVLVVDDEPDIIGALELCWNLQGVEVVTTTSPREALVLLERNVPDVILSDYRMPGMDGLEFLEHARRSYPGIPAVLMTAFTDPGLEEQAKEAGVVDFVPKPFDVLELLERVRAAAGS